LEEEILLLWNPKENGGDEIHAQELELPAGIALGASC
jgi:hypothetical protein